MSFKPGNNHHLFKQAHAEYQSALRDGRVRREATCEDCGAGGKTKGHHEDYARPLDVRWLCSLCHRRAHAGPKPGEAAISFRCDPQWARLIKANARLSGLTMQAICVQAISEFVGVISHVS